MGTLGYHIYHKTAQIGRELYYLLQRPSRTLFSQSLWISKKNLVSDCSQKSCFKSLKIQTMLIIVNNLVSNCGIQISIWNRCENEIIPCFHYVCTFSLTTILNIKKILQTECNTYYKWLR